MQEYGLEEEMAQHLTSDRAFAEYFEAAVREHSNPAAIGNWMLGELTFELKQAGTEIGDFTVSPADLALLMKLVDKNVISGKIAKEVFAEMAETGDGPEDIVSRKGLKQISDTGELESIIDGIIKANPDKAEAYRNGKTGLIGFFVGQVMQQTRGQANPQVVNQLLREKL